ncbi:MAG: hypothetical protein HY590_05575 [Candidatus Omnitrophica bacterium]|nr:hypothetical protein [Candidatus Omnitrophota bacterium]
MKKRIWVFLFCGAALVLVLVDRFLLAAEEPSSSLKMSGVLKKIDLRDSNIPRLVVVGESGLEKDLLLSTDTLIFFEKSPLKVEELRPEDVVDIEYEIEPATQRLLAKNVSVIVRPASEPAAQNSENVEDPEFEGAGKDGKKNSM